MNPNLQLRCLSAIGVIAGVLETDMAGYVTPVWNLLKMASECRIEPDGDNINCVNNLREAIIECYAYLLVSLKDFPEMRQTVAPFLNLIELVSNDCVAKKTSNG